MKKSATPRTALAAGIAKVLKRLDYSLDVMGFVRMGGIAKMARLA
jgi:hypothetical protein